MRILVIRAGALGDTAYASSIIDPLILTYGKAITIDWAAKSGMGALFQDDPRINRIFELKSRRSPFPINPQKWALVKASWEKPYDLVVNLETGSLFDTVMRLLKAKQKVGSPYDHFKVPPEKHAVEHLHVIYKNFMKDNALKIAQPHLQGTKPSLVMEKFGLTQGYVVFAPSNSHHNASSAINHRAWPMPYWLTLIRELSKTSRQVVLIGGKNEDKHFAPLKPLPNTVIYLVGKTPLPDLIGLIQGAALLVSTDTGPSHIAAAVNTPVYALIGPTNFKQTGPFKTQQNLIKILSANLPCSPCYHTPALSQCRDNQCMKKITPETVLTTILDPLKCRKSL